MSPTLLSPAIAEVSVATLPATSSVEADSTSTDPKTPDPNEEFQTITITKTKSSRITVTIAQKHTATHPWTTPTDVLNETEFRDNDKAKPTKDADKGAGESMLPSGYAKKTPSSNMNAPGSVGNKQLFSNSTVKRFKAPINDEPRLYTILTETPTLLGSKEAPALASENPSQPSNAGGAAKLSAANAGPSGFRTVSTPAFKGAAETKQ